MRGQLRDTVTIVRSGQDEGDGVQVRATVYYTSTAVAAESGSLYATEQLRAITEPLPRDLAPSTDGVFWRGTRYSLSGAPMLRMRRGKVHHVTIPLQRTVT